MNLRSCAALSLLSLLAACATEPTPGALAADPPAADPLAAAERAALDHLAPLLAREDLHELRVDRVRADITGTTHVRALQRHGGVPVLGGQVIVHLRPDGSVAALSDDLLRDLTVDTTPALAASEAAERAQAAAFAGAAVLSAAPQTSLWVLRHEGQEHLAWRVQLHRVWGDGADAAPVVFLDAHTGEVVFQYNNLQALTCSGATNFYGVVAVDCLEEAGTYSLADLSDGLGTFSYFNGTSTLSPVTSASTSFAADRTTVNAVEAHFAMEQVAQYFAQEHGRDGIDGLGGPTYMEAGGLGLITAATSYSTQYVNAFWDPVLMFTTYGDGDGVWSDSLTTLDIVGHELAHGITQFEAGLVYRGESGHLNEATSDIFGNLVERWVLGESADTWTVGEHTWTPGTSGDALRYMDDPAADGVSHDFRDATTRLVDVHYGSGVPNLAFTLMSQGGSHPRGRSSEVVVGIGADAAAQIWYLALTEYMGPTTNFSEAARAMVLAAESLYGEGVPEVQAVRHAWAAVGVEACQDEERVVWLGPGEQAALPDDDGEELDFLSQSLRWSSATDGVVDLRIERLDAGSWVVVAELDAAAPGELLQLRSTPGTYRAVAHRDGMRRPVAVSWCR